MTPLALYLHIPFCTRKCPYCDFHSRETNPVPEARYVRAVIQELDLWRARADLDDRPLHSLFFGGGTPSRFSPGAIDTLLTAIRDRWSLEPDCEITLEANPESVSPDRLAGYQAAGVNRLSLGVQALDRDRLALLGRIHDVAGAQRAFLAARAAGFDNIGLDLIYATPGHSPNLWRRELAEAMAWGPDHLSCYSLTLEPGTPFAQQHPGEPVMGEIGLALFELTREILAGQGWMPYEISNFSRPGYTCAHNRNYWEFGDYLGVGCAAHGKLTAPDGTIRRTEGTVEVEDYLARLEGGGSPWITDRILPRQEAAAECLMMGLRQTVGLDRSRHARLAGEDITVLKQAELALLVAEGLAILTRNRLALTPRGIALTDSILLRLL
ncbi:MAG: radical SAM family heme chaperone HemW [Magnetococcales bacterium]|nr:radical SAM family heme chaperone HemW [Magnetococcales bacterium]